MWGVDNFGTYTQSQGTKRYSSLHLQRRKEFPNMSHEENIYLKIGKNTGMFDKVKEELNKSEREKEELWKDSE